MYTEGDAGLVSVGLHSEDDALVVFFAEPARLEQRNGGPTVLAGDSARPEIGDGGFAIDGGVEVFKVGLCLLKHPPAPSTYVPSEVSLDGDDFGVHGRQ